ncbi:hypothetical protein GHT06_003846 [Daphnia sinensis]|uniref:Uncharacterized protein n=1 Tax=Daphnia sinensis TaxID=1820382 RepID=A0AAD5PNJ8_9CRUS|nr:hypothetical protein GHT06_003846 [Daphnia sinensis]
MGLRTKNVQARPLRARYGSKKGSQSRVDFMKDIAHNDVESRFATRLDEFARRRKAGDKDAEAEEIDFIMNALPFLSDHYKENTVTESRSIYKDYLSKVEDVFTPVAVVEQTCNACCEGRLVPQGNVDDMVCEGCGEIEYGYSYFTKPEQTTARARVNRQQVYRPINHFNDMLIHFQGKELTYVPETVIDYIRNAAMVHFPMERTMTHVHTRKLLRLKKYNKYYRNIPNIMQRAFGIQPPQFTEEQLATLRAMFQDTEVAFRETCNDRINFLSVNFLLFKFCELLGWNSYLSLIPLLKSSSKLYDHDNKWSSMCRHLGWHFVKTRVPPRCLI